MEIGFVQGGFLAALAALAIPLALHFIHRSRPQLTELGSIRFLRVILERTRNRRRVMRWLLLALRIGLVALFALLFARPFLPQQIDGGEDQLRMVLVDGSGSMRFTRDGKSLFERASALAAELSAGAPAESRVVVATFTDRVATIEVDDLPSQEASNGVTDYAAALRWAADLARQSSATVKQVHMITDLQQSGLQGSEAAALPGDLALHLHDVAGRDLNNVAITAVDLQRLVVRPGQAAAIEATINNFGPFELEKTLVALTLHCEKRQLRIEQRVRIPTRGMETVRFMTPPLEAGRWQGTVSIEAVDDFVSDNVRHVAVLSAPPQRLLLVDGDGRDSIYLNETYFLDLALRLATSDGKASESSPYVTHLTKSGKAALPELSPYAAVVLANVSGLEADDAKRLAAFVRNGGGLLIFGGDRVTTEGSRALLQAGLIPGTLGANRANEDLPFRIDAWDKEHSILAPFADPQHGDLQRLTFRGCTPLLAADGADVLATFGDGTPALVEHALGKGRVLWFASPCDLSWSDWPRTSLFLPLVHQMVGRLTGLNDGGPVRSLSTSVAGLQATPGVTDRGDFVQVVNLDPRESETARCTEADLRTRFSAPRPGVAEGASADDSADVVTGGNWAFRQNELWHWVVAALVGLAVLEFVVGNRVVA